jgi:UDP-N-acetylmuramate--alanine ligase
LSLLINDISIDALHFVGILGSGMSAIAQFLSWYGLRVSGSDRSVNKPETAVTGRSLLEAGCTLHPQDGSGITETTGALCVSTAIEKDNPDLMAARGERSLPVFHRSEVLAAIVDVYRTIAVAGTSGKSTVTAMIFEFLTSCGKSPSLITGAGLKRLERQGLIGNAFFGTSDILVIEADESDGTLIRYHPELSLFLNVSKDHKPVVEVKALFRQLARQSRYSIKNADDPQLDTITTTGTFALTAPADWRPETFTTADKGSTLVKDGTEFRLPLIGRHNLSNCAAALAVAEKFGCTAAPLQTATASFEGVARRFTISRTPSGIIVVDDFAHNPEKIRSAVSAARSIAPRVIAVYQPHGFGPTRFLRDEYRELFGSLFTGNDILILLPIYYAGGTAVKDISAADLKNDLGVTEFQSFAPETRKDALPIIKQQARKGDCVLVMGARDPSLPVFTGEIVGGL